MSQRFVVTPAAGGAENPDPATTPEPPLVDALPILNYGREPSRYGTFGQTRTSPRGCADLRRVAASRASQLGGRWPGWESGCSTGLGNGQRGVEPVRCVRSTLLGDFDSSPIPAGPAVCPVAGPRGRC